jgi:hypothetical protein
MSQAFITCPKTGQRVYVGLNYEWLQLDSVELEEQDLDCPECGKTHRWTTDDVVLQADGAG